MKQIQVILTAIILFASTNLFAQKAGEIDGVTIPRTVKFSDKEITLNGVGVRSKFIFQMYTQALYLTNLSSDANEIVNSNTTMGMIFYMTSPLVTSKRFANNLDEAIKKNVGEVQWKKFKPELDLMLECINKDQIVKNDVFNIIYNDIDSSLWIIKNGVVKGKVPGFEFKKAFFEIWLGDKPVKETLKSQLLSVVQQ